MKYRMDGIGRMLDDDGVPFVRKMQKADDDDDLASWSKWYHKLDEALKARVHHLRQMKTARIRVRLTRYGVKWVMGLGMDIESAPNSSVLLRRDMLLEAREKLLSVLSPDMSEPTRRSIFHNASILQEEHDRPGSHLVVPKHELGRGVSYAQVLKSRDDIMEVEDRSQKRPSARRRRTG